jgi:D-tyrosyl-tRNA(Tyr) deacylase
MPQYCFCSHRTAVPWDSGKWTRVFGAHPLAIHVNETLLSGMVIMSVTRVLALPFPVALTGTDHTPTGAAAVSVF